MNKPMMIGKSKTQRTIQGIPVFWAAKNNNPLPMTCSPNDLHNGIPGDSAGCSLVLTASRQLESPCVRIGRDHVYVAVPMPVQGVEVPGVEGKWGILACKLDAEGRRVTRLIDEEQVGKVTSGTIVTFLPRRKPVARPRKQEQPGREKPTARKQKPQTERSKWRHLSGRVWA